ncbi:MAG TPA: hypothetical protein VHY82_07825 [Acetobacteraceae bacterium]|jgi:hypothetical protein|nr:hypothetical protein [Acetobacteraceae bacterium]
MYRQGFLLGHLRCAYCGGPATTTDHCPARCCFRGRQWPEGYEFPACEPCNQAGRLDEQVLAVFFCVKLNQEGSTAEWQALMRGTANNQRAILDEWLGMSRNQQRSSLRQAFGMDGDAMRRAGWGSINLGPLSHGVIERFIIKLGKALYYKHLGEIFDGVIYARHISAVGKDATPELFDDVLRLAPQWANTERNGRSLADQFVYRFNSSEELGVVYAVVQFSSRGFFS